MDTINSDIVDNVESNECSWTKFKITTNTLILLVIYQSKTLLSRIKQVLSTIYHQS